MKKAVLAIVIFTALFSIASAQSRTDITVRAGKHNNMTRLVFESEETFIKNTNVTASDMKINIEFPSAFNLISQKGFNLETSTKGRLLTISPGEPFEIKVLRLSSPPRLAIDIHPKGTAEAKVQADIILSQKVFVIDPGHGGYDFGITGSDLKEKDITLSIARNLEDLLTKKGKRVFLTRRSDQHVSLKDRALLSNQKSPDVFLSIHVSASENFAIYIPKTSETAKESPADLYSLNARQKKYIEKSRKLAEGIGKALMEEFHLSVLQREMSLPVLNSVGAPAVLIEVPSFKIMSYDQKTHSRLAEALLNGFYYGY